MWISPWQLKNTGVKDDQLSSGPLINSTIVQIYGNSSKGVGNEDLLSKHLHIMCCYLKVMACHLHLDSCCICITWSSVSEAQPWGESSSIRERHDWQTLVLLKISDACFFQERFIRPLKCVITVKKGLYTLTVGYQQNWAMLNSAAI